VKLRAVSRKTEMCRVKVATAGKGVGPLAAYIPPFAKCREGWGTRTFVAG